MTRVLKTKPSSWSAAAATNRLPLLAALLLLFSAGAARAEVISGFVYPVMSPRLSSDYGRRIHPIRRFSQFHQGIDLAAPRGVPIRSIRAGTVVFADPYAGYGKLIVIRHENGMTSHYGHCGEIRVNPGQNVLAGQIIGSVGNTGLSTGPHLHFEVRFNGAAVDPERYVPGLSLQGQG